MTSMLKLHRLAAAPRASRLERRMTISQKLSITDVVAAAARLNGASAHPHSKRAQLTAALAAEDVRVVVAFAKIGLEKWGEEIGRERELERLRATAGELRRNGFLKGQRAVLERELARIAALLDACSDEPDRGLIAQPLTPSLARAIEALPAAHPNAFERAPCIAPRSNNVNHTEDRADDITSRQRPQVG